MLLLTIVVYLLRSYAWCRGCNRQHGALFVSASLWCKGPIARYSLAEPSSLKKGFGLRKDPCQRTCSKTHHTNGNPYNNHKCHCTGGGTKTTTKGMSSEMESRQDLLGSSPYGLLKRKEREMKKYEMKTRLDNVKTNLQNNNKLDKNKLEE